MSNNKRTPAELYHGGGGFDELLGVWPHYRQIEPESQEHVPGPVETFLSLCALGAGNAISSRRAMTELGFTSERMFRQAVERERAQGALILANGRGLYLPEQGEQGREEISRYIRLGQSRIRGQARALQEARRELRRLARADQLQLLEVEQGGVDENGRP